MTRRSRAPRSAGCAARATPRAGTPAAGARCGPARRPARSPPRPPRRPRSARRPAPGRPAGRRAAAAAAAAVRRSGRASSAPTTPPTSSAVATPTSTAKPMLRRTTPGRQRPGVGRADQRERRAARRPGLHQVRRRRPRRWPRPGSPPQRPVGAGLLQRARPWPARSRVRRPAAAQHGDRDALALQHLHHPAGADGGPDRAGPASSSCAAMTSACWASTSEVTCRAVIDTSRSATSAATPTATSATSRQLTVTRRASEPRAALGGSPDRLRSGGSDGADHGASAAYPTPAHRADRAGRAELGPHLGDVHVHGAGAGRRGVPPHGAEQLLPREHPAGRPHQVGEQVELGRGQRDLGAARPAPAAGRPPARPARSAAPPRRPPVGPARRSTVRTRATSSRGLNGLVT